ncbi:hypothetical protein BG011_002273 [Mortierella polycephala]|uniref:Uncharacterized protein n=1 Tax=Mortierella polycephala TaxID=41804 RepID=A0A9P6QH27_9FUNG|nr:hypothetical protein BG011_002273 [Mortierella polycephala]
MFFGKKALALLALFGLATSSYAAPTSLTTLDDVVAARLNELVPILIPHDIVVAVKYTVITTRTNRYTSHQTIVEATEHYDGWQEYQKKISNVGQHLISYDKKTCLDNGHFCIKVKIHSKTCDLRFWIRNQEFSFDGANKVVNGGTVSCGMTWAAER